MKKLLSIALCLIAVSGFAQKGKTKMAADFYGVDYSCVSVVGANEQPAEFIKAFEAINRLFLSEPKKYDVAGFTGIDILSTNVEQANEALGGLAAEQFTPRSTKADIAAQLPGILARYDNGSGNKGLVLIATTLDKGNGMGTTRPCCSIPPRRRSSSRWTWPASPAGSACATIGPARYTTPSRSRVNT